MEWVKQRYNYKTIKIRFRADTIGVIKGMVSALLYSYGCVLFIGQVKNIIELGALISIHMIGVLRYGKKKKAFI